MGYLAGTGGGLFRSGLGRMDENAWSRQVVDFDSELMKGGLEGDWGLEDDCGER